ncbi:MAG: enoyl-CoA hydratase-related protein [Flavobacteriaceae bacterium]|jgi:enoyl-CoA hydratase/carnithine racemase/acyl dehydratase|nr:enoyl-CoA hydratase-related protein [Flavobacteriaceae bacterium]MDG1090562.1 enoyl-CoA hydratase-related protein [Flavobacteriaceae bacterium]
MEQQTNTAYATRLTNTSELSAYIGKELGLTEWMPMTQQRINTFADATEDFQWIHTDVERSASFSPYKKTVAHGFLVLSMASKVSYDTFSIENVAMGVNYGLDKVRFPNATKSGNFFRGRVSLLECDEIKGGVKYKMEIVFELKGEDKPACVAEFIAIAYAGPGKKAQEEIAKATEKQKPSETVLLKKQENIAIVTLNRPERYNAVTDELVTRLNEIIDEIRNDNQIRAVVLTGAGKGFSAGADMESFGKVSPEDGRAYITRVYQTLLRNFQTLKKPIIGAINGTAAGVGASIALACDLRVMTPSSGILYAFVNIGLGPDGGASWLLTRQVGYSKAFEIAAEGKKIKAEECLSLGLTNKIVDEDQLLEAAIEWAKALAAKAPIAVGITKEDLVHAMDNNLSESIAYEAEKQIAAFESYDLVEGVAAFVEKRKANFIGQ